MKNPYKKMIKAIHTEAIDSIRNRMQNSEYMNLLYEEDSKHNCTVRIYTGNRFPQRITLTGLENRNGKLLLCHFCDKYPVENISSDDILKLWEAVTDVTECCTPSALARIINRYPGIPVAIHDIIDRNGWEDLFDEDDEASGTLHGIVVRCPHQGSCIRLDENGKAVVVTDKPVNSKKTPKAKPVTASYDVAFEPMVNVTLEVADPEKPTDEEVDRIVALAVGKLRERILSPHDSTAEDLTLVRLYTVGGKKNTKEIIDNHPYGTPKI